MTISKEILLAILSMDSYNRGYGEGIGDLGGIGTLVGSAEILRQSDISEDGEAQAAGFYAISNEAYYFRWFWSY